MHGFNKHGSFHNVVSHSDNKVSIGTVFNPYPANVEKMVNS